MVPGAQPPGRGFPQPAAAPPPTRQMPRYDSPAPSYLPGAATPRPAARPAAPVPAVDYDEPVRAGGGAGRAVRAILVTLLLIAVPLIAMWVTYRLTIGETVWP
jgi:hypothetical protein